MKIDPDTSRRVADLIRHYTRGLTQEAIADKLSAVLDRTVRQSQVSEHLAGRRWTLDWFRVYADAFDIPAHEQHKVLNLPSRLDDPELDPRLPSLRTLIAQDDTLSDDAKQLLLAQYDYLQRSSTDKAPAAPKKSTRQSS